MKRTLPLEAGRIMLAQATLPAWSHVASHDAPSTGDPMYWSDATVVGLHGKLIPSATQNLTV